MFAWEQQGESRPTPPAPSPDVAVDAEVVVGDILEGKKSQGNGLDMP
jgi:hypothetical protein